MWCRSGNYSTVTFLKAHLDGAWLGSFYVITDVIDKEWYLNPQCIRPGAARVVIRRARLVGSPQKRFFHDPQRYSARAVEDCWSQENNTITRRLIPQAEPICWPSMFNLGEPRNLTFVSHHRHKNFLLTDLVHTREYINLVPTKNNCVNLIRK
jgi:hypothetical protein